MPCYYFHCDTDGILPDLDGTEIDTPEAARAAAIVLCGEMIREAPDSFWGSRPWSVTVTDERDRTLWVIRVDAMIAPAGATAG